MTLEIEIEQFLANNPYLIKESFSGALITRQPASGRNRLDLLIEHRGRFTIVEIKRTPIDDSALQQIRRYMEELESKGYRLAARHYLVGQRPSRELHTPRGVQILFLGEEIPLRYLFDTHARRYVRYDGEKAAMPGRYDSERRFVL